MHAMPSLRPAARVLCAALASLAISQAAAADADWHALNHQAAVQAKAHDYAGLHDTLLQLAPAMPGSPTDRKSTRLNSSHVSQSRMPSSA